MPEAPRVLVPRGRLVAFPILLLSLLAGCLEAPQAEPRTQASPDPVEARMREYLKTEYPRADAVEWDAFRVVSVENRTVGDVPLVVVVAVINAEGKEAVAYFDARDLRFLGDRPPSYPEATGSNRRTRRPRGARWSGRWRRRSGTRRASRST